MSEEKTVLIFGATGSCGRAVVERALDQGYNVTAFVRNANKASRLFGSEQQRLTIVEGDTNDRDSVIDAVLGHTAVISCLSSFESPHDSMSRLTMNLAIAAERTNGIKIRFVSYSLCGIEADGDFVSHAIQSALRVFSRGKFGPAIADHEKVIDILSASQLDYTLFQTATMVNKPQGDHYVSGTPSTCPGVRLWQRWGVLDAADVCLEALEQTNLRRLQMRYVPD